MYRPEVCIEIPEALVPPRLSNVFLILTMRKNFMSLKCFVFETNPNSNSIISTLPFSNYLDSESKITDVRLIGNLLSIANFLL